MRYPVRVSASAIAVLLLGGTCAAAPKLTEQERIALVRGMTAEYATAKAPLPRAKNALKLEPAGTYDKQEWTDAGRQWGPAARVGDLVQITRIDIQGDKIVLDINGGFKSGKGKWYQRIQIQGGSNSPVPISRGDSNAPGGTSIALLFHGPVPPVSVASLKKMLAPVLDFEKHSVTENYVDNLPEPIKAAVKEKRAVVGMDRDQVLLALGKPVRKVRQTVDGVETEDWVYGNPPGKIVFVTFDGNKVIKVKEDYAGLGSEAPALQTPR